VLQDRFTALKKFTKSDGSEDPTLVIDMKTIAEAIFHRWTQPTVSSDTSLSLSPLRLQETRTALHHSWSFKEGISLESADGMDNESARGMQLFRRLCHFASVPTRQRSGRPNLDGLSPSLKLSTRGVSLLSDDSSGTNTPTTGESHEPTDVCDVNFDLSIDFMADGHAEAINKYFCTLHQTAKAEIKNYCHRLVDEW